MQPSELLLPATTKGFLSTHDVDEVRTRFKETQLGAMVEDPVMKPFIDDLKEQLKAKLERAGHKLGVKWDDLEGVYSGEVALALVQPNPKDKMSHATVLLVDVTGKKQQVEGLLAKIDANQRNQRAVRSEMKAGAVVLTVYTQALKQGQREPDRAYYFISQDQLVATDELNTAVAIAGRFGGNAPDALAALPSFQYIMNRNQQEAGGERHHLRWFVEPFGYAEASRAARGGRRKRGQDMIKILRGQGFPAIEAIGGNIFFATQGVEMLHRTYVYAPGKRELAMRMLDFPNAAAGSLDPQPWVMSDVATYLTFNWKAKEAFSYSETLVDAIAGEKGLFKDIWEGMRTDPYGPKIDIYKGLVNHLGERATIMSDVVVPVTLKSERLVALIEVTDPATVAQTVEKAFEKDPQAKKRIFRGETIWEITQEEGLTEAEGPELEIEGAGFVSADEEEVAQRPGGKARPAPGGAQAAIPNMAIAVFKDHLVVATHVDFVEDLIARSGDPNSLGTMADFQRVTQELANLGANGDSFRFFSRTDESYRATYELLRQNQLPQSETMIARLLNGMFSEGEEDERVATRKQEIDGSKLPDFEAVKKYLGPGGVYVHTEKEGWLVVGCLLKKQ